MQLTSNEWMQKAGELEAEVERANAHFNEAVAERDAEIERLQQENALWQSHDIEKQREVERLTLDLDTQTKLKRSAQQDAAKGWVEVERLREENERLKQALAFYSRPTIHVAGHEVRLMPPLEEK